MTSLAPDIAAKVAELLESAKYASKGADMALAARNLIKAGELERKYRDLRTMALRLDPAKECPAWKL